MSSMSNRPPGCCPVYTKPDFYTLAQSTVYGWIKMESIDKEEQIKIIELIRKIEKQLKRVYYSRNTQ